MAAILIFRRSNEKKDSEPAAPVVVGKAQIEAPDKWDGEDEDGDIKEQWDAEAEEEEEEDDDESHSEKEAEVIAAVQKKKKKSLKEKIAEKEKQEMEDSLKKQEQPTNANLDAGEGDKEKVNEGGNNSIDFIDPSTKEQFDKLKDLLKDKISKYEKSPHYVSFLEKFLRDLSLNMESDDIKKLSSTITAVSNEKVKQQKGGKGKKKPKKATLIVGKDTGLDDLAPEDNFVDYDDFM